MRTESNEWAIKNDFFSYQIINTVQLISANRFNRDFIVKKCSNLSDSDWDSAQSARNGEKNDEK